MPLLTSLLDCSMDRPVSEERAAQERRAWRRLRLQPRSLDMSRTSESGNMCSIMSMDLDKISGRFLAAGRESILLHDVARFGSDEEYDLVAKTESFGQICDIHWYPQDTGMITFLSQRAIHAWDLNALQTLRCVSVEEDVAVSCHQLCPSNSSVGTVVAVGTAVGLFVYDFRQAKRVRTLTHASSPAFGSAARMTSVLWDGHRSDLLFSGSLDRQLAQWDLRQPERPLFVAPIGPKRTGAILDLKPLLGAEGGLPSLLVRRGNGRVYHWSMMDAKCTQRPETDAAAVDVVPGINLPAFMSSTALTIDGVCVAEVPALTAFVLNPFAREAYLYEQNHEKLLCLK